MQIKVQNFICYIKLIMDLNLEILRLKLIMDLNLFVVFNLNLVKMIYFLNLKSSMNTDRSHFPTNIHA
jgi:hypothetical protein